MLLSNYRDRLICCLSWFFILEVGVIARDFAVAFYKSQEWSKVRQYVLMRDKYKCQKCNRPAQEVHHIKHLTPDNIWDPWIALNPDNLISLCKACHFDQHKEDKAAGKKNYDKDRNADCNEGYHFDENGMLVPD